MKVKELIEKLQSFELDAELILDDDGNTYDVPEPELWCDDEDSPVAFYIG